ncbi:MAG: salicylate 1-monooxygenase [Alphaproteobacteria bacterium]|nr:salicylate 1-monooxygenase [Alphaproteobacteria bacterium]
MKKIAIIGAGISGLYFANLFKGNPNYQIIIYEKNNSLDLNEGYGIQLSVNSIKLLNKIGFQNFNSQDKFNPNKIDFYSANQNVKICDLNIADFNTIDCKYTTLKRSILIKYLKENLNTEIIKYDHNISKINYTNDLIKLVFQNNISRECDFLIISDGIFSKAKTLITNNLVKPSFNGSIAVRGIINKKDLTGINLDNISLFLGKNFHNVIYPMNEMGEFNYIAILKYHLKFQELKTYEFLNDNSPINKFLGELPYNTKIKKIKYYPVFISNNFYKPFKNNLFLLGDAFFAVPPSFAQGASQSIEGAFELYESIQNNSYCNFYSNRIKRLKIIKNRSKINQFAFHLSSPIMIFLRNFFLKVLTKNKKFLENYLGKVYRN